MPLDTTRAGLVTGPSALPAPGDGSLECGRYRDARWYVALTEHRAEELARGECAKRGLQTFLPLIRDLVECADGRTRRVTVPAFPGYLFVLASPADWHGMKRCRGIAGVLHHVGDREAPAIMPTGVVEAWLARASLTGVIEDLSVPDAPRDELDPGQQVRVTAGPFSRFTGLVQRSGAERVVVLLSIFGRSGPVELHRRHIEPIQDPQP